MIKENGEIELLPYEGSLRNIDAERKN